MTKQILYIEDDIYNIRLVKKMLKPMGYEVIEATDAMRGIQMAHQYQPDVILMDVSLPDISGYEATEHLKNTPELAHIPVIIFTADTTQQVYQRSIDAGCDAYLNKPISSGQLLRTIAQVCATTASTAS
jgi:two-component system cell cycle response regulator DivK